MIKNSQKTNLVLNNLVLSFEYLFGNSGASGLNVHL